MLDRPQFTDDAHLHTMFSGRSFCSVSLIVMMRRKARYNKKLLNKLDGFLHMSRYCTLDYIKPNRPIPSNNERLFQSSTWPVMVRSFHSSDYF
jgi:hypothetical protein